MKKILIGSNNQGKFIEFKKFLASLNIEAVNPKKLGKTTKIKESGNTFKQNALIKAKSWAEKTCLPVLVDDSGLEVDFLSGKPGVKSKRFFPGSDEDRNKKILRLLSKTENRSARYICILVFLDKKKGIEKISQGICEGRIGEKILGKNGFGYDPIFIPEGLTKTFAELENKTKSKISHRARAFLKIENYLRKWKNNEN